MATTPASTTTDQLDIPIGAPCWMDLISSDAEKSIAFYSELFGWTAVDTPPQFGGYRYFTKDGKAVGGCMQNNPEWGAPDAWSIYLKSKDVRATAAAALTHGGEVVMEPMDVFDNGSQTIIKDAGGAMISAWQPGTEVGFGVLRDDNTPRWFELHTRDFDKSVQFYREVFHWDPSVLINNPDFRYTTFTGGEDNKAGIMDAGKFLPEGVPAHWSVYIGSGDVDATLARAVELGGTVLLAAEDTPYGRLAAATDPTGAVFKLHG